MKIVMIAGSAWTQQLCCGYKESERVTPIHISSTTVYGRTPPVVSTWWWKSNTETYFYLILLHQLQECKEGTHLLFRLGGETCKSWEPLPPSGHTHHPYWHLLLVFIIIIVVIIIMVRILTGIFKSRFGIYTGFQLIHAITKYSTWTTQHQSEQSTSVCFNSLLFVLEVIWRSSEFLHFSVRAFVFMCVNNFKPKLKIFLSDLDDHVDHR